MLIKPVSLLIQRYLYISQDMKNSKDHSKTFSYICVVILTRLWVCYVFNINLWSKREWILSYKIPWHIDNNIDDEKFSTSPVSYVPGMALCL